MSRKETFCFLVAMWFHKEQKCGLGIAHSPVIPALRKPRHEVSGFILRLKFTRRLPKKREGDS